MKQLLLVALLFIAKVSDGQDKLAKEYYLAGYQSADNRNYHLAIESYLKALKIDSTGECGTKIKGKVQGELGFAYLRVGDTANAIRYLDESISLDSTTPYPIQNKAVLLSMQKKFPEAYDLLDVLIRNHPEFIDAYIQRGFLYENDKKFELAKIDFKKALKLNEKTNKLPLQLVSELKELIAGNQNQ